jgi:hypothetical protein
LVGPYAVEDDLAEAEVRGHDRILAFKVAKREAWSIRLRNPRVPEPSRASFSALQLDRLAVTEDVDTGARRAVLRDWLSATRAAIASCECVDACPSCVQSPKCGNGNNPLDKARAIVVLDLVLGRLPTD